MCFLFRLSTDLIVLVLFEWISENGFCEIGMLDSACCNQLDRIQFCEVLKFELLVWENTNELRNDLFIKWLNLRRIQVNILFLSIENNHWLMIQNLIFFGLSLRMIHTVHLNQNFDRPFFSSFTFLMRLVNTCQKLELLTVCTIDSKTGSKTVVTWSTSIIRLLLFNLQIISYYSNFEACALQQMIHNEQFQCSAILSFRFFGKIISLNTIWHYVSNYTNLQSLVVTNYEFNICIAYSNVDNKKSLWLSVCHTRQIFRDWNIAWFCARINTVIGKLTLTESGDRKLPRHIFRNTSTLHSLVFGEGFNLWYKIVIVLFKQCVQLQSVSILNQMKWNLSKFKRVFRFLPISVHKIAFAVIDYDKVIHVLMTETLLFCLVRNLKVVIIASSCGTLNSLLIKELYMLCFRQNVNLVLTE
jgi:hypothetical protein